MTAPRSHGISVSAWTWRGRTTVKWRWSSVASLGDVETLSQSDNAGVGRAERQVRILLDQLGGSGEIVGRGAHDGEEPCLEGP
jgi:hypothetical protein